MSDVIWTGLTNNNNNLLSTSQNSPTCVTDVKDVRDAALFSLYACVLHNFCIEEKLLIGETEKNFRIEPQEEINNFLCIGSSRSDAVENRD